MNRMNVIKHKDLFNFREVLLSDLEDFLTQQTQNYKLETVICLEFVTDTCYQTLAGLVQNQSIRKEYLRFEHYAQHHQAGLRKIFSLSSDNETAVANKVYECLMQVKSRHLFLKSVIDLAISITAYKIEIYEYFSVKHQEHHELFNNFIEDSIEEINFLRQERKFHQDNAQCQPQTILP